MSLKLNFSNWRALEGSRARQRKCVEPNFEFCVPFLLLWQQIKPGARWRTVATQCGQYLLQNFMCLQQYISLPTTPPPHTRHQNMESRARNVMPYVRLSARMPYRTSSSAYLLCQQFQPGLCAYIDQIPICGPPVSEFNRVVFHGKFFQNAKLIRYFNEMW